MSMSTMEHPPPTQRPDQQEELNVNVINGTPTTHPPTLPPQQEELAVQKMHHAAVKNLLLEMEVRCVCLVQVSGWYR